MRNRFKKYIGDKTFYKAVLSVAVPLMLQQLITSSVNLIDNVMVGQLGDAALGGVTAFNRYYFIAVFAANGIIAAASVFISQYFGAKNDQKTKEVFRFSLVVGFGILLFFCILASLFPHLILGFFTTDEATIAQGMMYAKYAAFTFIPLAISLNINGAFRACGETLIPLATGVMSALINMIFNYLLIFGNFGFPEMRVSGAALATLIARIIEMIVLIFMLYKSKMPFKTKLTSILKFPKELAERILIKATPLCINEVLWSGGMAMLFKFYSTRGAEVMSGYSIASTVSDLFFVLFGGMAVASNILISQELGANNLDVARDNGYRLIGFSTFLAIVFGVLMFASSFIFPHFYNVSDVARGLSQTVIRIQGCMFWVYMFTSMCYFILRAGGDMKSTLIMDSVYMWTVNLPLVGLLAYYTDLSIVVLYLAGQSTDLVKMAISFWLVKKEKWVHNLTEDTVEI